MKQFEDIIKEQLDGYEINLPKGDFDEFKNLLDKAERIGSKRAARYFIWLIPALMVCSVSLLIFGLSRKPEMPRMDNDNLMRTKVLQAAVDEENREFNVVADIPVDIHSVQQSSVIIPDREEEAVQNGETEGKSEKQETKNQSCGVSQTEKNVPKTYVHSNGSTNKKSKDIKVWPAVAGVIGGSGAIALAGTLSSLNRIKALPDVIIPSTSYGSDPFIEEKAGDDIHNMPIRINLSLRIPFNERWSLTTGVDYSLYSSRIGYQNSYYKKQKAHYVGIPLRVDFSIVRNRWLDVYVGPGISADFCVAAFEDGRKIAKDGIAFALNGVGGAQFNITRNLGLFLEPAISWNIPSRNRVLDTYKTEHPIMFSVSTGLRITIPGER